MAAVGAVALVLGPATVALAEPPQAIAENASDGDLKWAPVLDYDTDSCYATPAISPEGVPAEGLSIKEAETLTDGCRDPSDLESTNAYVRTWCQNGWCAHKYAYYFEMDKGADSAGHRHDLEHAVVWVQNDQVRYVAVSGHGEYEIKDAADIQFEGNHPKIVYNKDGPFTHRLRHASAADDPPENDQHTWQRPALVGWELMDPKVREIFANHDYGSATLALKDSQYAGDLKKAKKVEPPWDFDAPLPSTDPPAPDPGPSDPPDKDRDLFLKLMPMGDSVTDGVGSSKGYGYRKPLRDKLVGGGSTVDMVGYNRSGDMIDADHEGHSGKRITEIFDNASRGVSAFKPNVVTLLAGTNDLGQGVDVDGAPARLTTMIQQVRSLDDGVVIAVGTVPNSKDPDMQRKADSYNASISRLVRAYPDDYHVILADMGALILGDMADDLHPNDAGYEKIAASFARAVNTAIDKGWVEDRDPNSIDNGTNGVASAALGPVNWYPQGTVAGGVGSDGDSIRLADLNGDGRDDYLSVTDNGATYARINGGGTPDNWIWYDYQKIAGGVGSDGDSIRFADINGDGRDDYLSVSPEGAVRAWVNGGGAPNDWIWYDYQVIAGGVGAPRENIRFADLDGDGRDDYVVLNDDGSAQAWLNRGGVPNDWSWGQADTIAGGVGVPGSQVRFADINGDGFDDYLTVGDGGKTYAWLNGNGVRNNWTWNQVVEPIASGVGSPGDQVRFAELNGDRRADYFVVNPENGAMTARTN